ncbi:MAG: hypothetical protein MHPSP_003336, partial [Paramarteilia canceri]
ESSSLCEQVNSFGVPLSYKFWKFLKSINKLVNVISLELDKKVEKTAIYISVAL